MTESLSQRYQHTRRQSLQACEPLLIEDFALQAEAFTSPPKWHLAHTTWFFETFLLQPFLDHYQTPNEQYQMLFNSYYNGVGKQFARPCRGLLSRPTLDEVKQYRADVDHAILQLLSDADHPQRQSICALTALGVAHEQQHQELFYTDLKYSLAANPLFPAYTEAQPTSSIIEAEPYANLQWHAYPGGRFIVGCETDPTDEQSFAFDNEGPAHAVYLTPYELANRLVTNAEFQDFVDDGGYHRPEYWLADGWAAVQQQQWGHPLYWVDRGTTQLQFTLHGLQPRRPQEPVCHLSAYEADAYATWAGARLPTEFEWECAAARQPFPLPEFDARKLHPAPASGDEPLLQLYSDCWQWTGSAYRPYPGFKAGGGAIGEYNGKFMSNQWVLRGGSCVTPDRHVRPSYRNFFYPQDRWQFSGLRLARDL